MLKHLTETDVHAIIKAAEQNNSVRSSRALEGAIKKLSRDAWMELVALVWLGRGDVEGRFADHLKEARRTPHPVAYITEKSPALPKYLREGLRKLSSEGRP